MVALEWSKQPGVNGLPLKVRFAFGQALAAEEAGDFTKAHEKLDEAIRLESAPPEPTK
jgi:hypothetical protein